MRKTFEELEKIKNDYNVDMLWSFSRYNCYKNDPYGYYLKYIQKVKEDKDNGIYGQSGGAVHDILERYYNNEIEYEDMLDLYEDKTIEFEFKDLKYNRVDEDKNRQIQDKYEKAIKDFFQNHNSYKNDESIKDIQLEEFVLCKIDKFLFQGYVDFMYKQNDDVYIVDWKTSTIYTGKKIDDNKQQLVLYAQAIHQTGVPLENIKIGWNFVKYITMYEPQKAFEDEDKTKRKYKKRQIPRNEIYDKTKTKVIMWLKEFGYEDNIDDILLEFNKTNDFSVLPKDITEMYKFEDCFVEIELNEDVVNELNQDINNTLNDILAKTEEYQLSKDDMIFYEDIKEQDEYFFYNICGYSRKLHKPFDEYLKEKEKFIINSNDCFDLDSDDNDDLLNEILGI